MKLPKYWKTLTPKKDAPKYNRKTYLDKKTGASHIIECNKKYAAGSSQAALQTAIFGKEGIAVHLDNILTILDNAEPLVDGCINNPEGAFYNVIMIRDEHSTLIKEINSLNIIAENNANKANGKNVGYYILHSMRQKLLCKE